jgi:hypothetical protein
MESSRLCIRDGVIPGDYRCPICGSAFQLVGHDPVVTLATTTHPVCTHCAERLAPRLSAVVSLWKRVPFEERWLNAPFDGGNDDNEQPRSPDAHRQASTGQPPAP